MSIYWWPQVINIEQFLRYICISRRFISPSLSLVRFSIEHTSGGFELILIGLTTLKRSQPQPQRRLKPSKVTTIKTTGYVHYSDSMTLWCNGYTFALECGFDSVQMKITEAFYFASVRCPHNCILLPFADVLPLTLTYRRKKIDSAK